MAQELNQNPEQLARDQIDVPLAAAGWVVQDMKALKFNADLGVAVPEYQTYTGPPVFGWKLFIDVQASTCVPSAGEMLVRQKQRHLTMGQNRRHYLTRHASPKLPVTLWPERQGNTYSKGEKR